MIRRNQQLDEKPFQKARQALASAKLARDRMLRTATFDQLEHEWRSFLNYIDQVLSKLKAGYSRAGGRIGPWIGLQTAIQGTDELLQYLAQARDADQHTVQDGVAVKPGSYEFRVKGPGPVYIEKLVVGRRGVEEYRGTGEAELRITPARMEVLPVESRGVRYDPPETHLGRPVGTRDTAVLAELALQHYEGVLRAFAAEFLSPTATRPSG